MATVLAVASPGLKPGALVRVLCGRGYVFGRVLASAHARERGRTTTSVTLSFVVPSTSELEVGRDFRIDGGAGVGRLDVRLLAAAS
jgi:hypothetical protein